MKVGYSVNWHGFRGRLVVSANNQQINNSQSQEKTIFTIVTTVWCRHLSGEMNKQRQFDVNNFHVSARTIVSIAISDGFRSAFSSARSTVILGSFDSCHVHVLRSCLILYCAVLKTIFDFHLPVFREISMGCVIQTPYHTLPFTYLMLHFSLPSSTQTSPSYIAHLASHWAYAERRAAQAGRREALVLLYI